MRRPPCRRWGASSIAAWNLSPPGGGSRRPQSLTARATRASFTARAARRGASPMSEPKIPDADLELLLAEADRDDPILRDPREDAEQPRETIDSQILAGLVSP